MAVSHPRGRKQLTLLHCCDSINISRFTEYMTIDGHKFTIHLVYCKNCGSLKANSHIKETETGNE